MIHQLGKALSIILVHEAGEIAMHEDVDAFHAPSECHRDVSKGEMRRLRTARRHAEAVAQRPWRVIAKEARKRGFQFAGPRFERVFSRIYSKHGFPGGQR
jgi:hypothetical protein